ncbi:Iron-regulated ABC transporter permease protein SufD [Pedococcus cremeus]|uniref:Iron-regulated ABC transporter permease protein SufD n=1 Tax=Pedococcus cremeus TaxID=587636 RepID=A0A1H9WZZ5_9MICO|nr:Fe-S cluster assembly protein SufD [Pedococcus cremeus]SES39237.1 Iron-regulated ABC transporter permease protein SufD [Pedococcus cremeus]
MSLLADKPRPTEGAHTHSAETMVPDQSRAERKTSYAVADFPVPGGREEDWRFTPVDRLSGLFAEEGSAERAVTVESEAPEGVELLSLPMDDERVGSAYRPADRAAVTAWAGTERALYVGIAKEAELDAPVLVRLTGTGAGRGNGHTVIEAGRHSRATVVLQHSGSAQHNAGVEVRVGDGADLTVVSVQEWDDDAIHVAQHDALIGRDAHLKHVVVTLGGEIVRVSTNARYAGPGGSFEGLGVYFADAGQHQEHRLFVDHEAPHCTSNVEYKGALQGDTAHTVWVGDVLIRAAAEGTDTYELNRNLVLTEGARADSVPNLEIETGEIIGAGHASATGRFDDEQLFYLQSRGIDEAAARRLVVRGFFASIIGRIGVPEVQEHLMAAIDVELEGVEGAAVAQEADDSEGAA